MSRKRSPGCRHQLAADQVQLGVLGLGQRHVRPCEVGAGVDAPRIQPQRIEGVADIVVELDLRRVALERVRGGRAGPAQRVAHQPVSLDTGDARQQAGRRGHHVAHGALDADLVFDEALRNLARCGRLPAAPGWTSAATPARRRRRRHRARGPPAGARSSGHGDVPAGPQRFGSIAPWRCILASAQIALRRRQPWRAARHLGRGPGLDRFCLGINYFVMNILCIGGGPAGLYFGC
jgi:hypothetical protein